MLRSRHLRKPWSPADSCSDRCRSDSTPSRRNSMGKLEGKIALITGGTSGIGLATAKQFVSEGAYVFIVGRHESELSAAIQAVGRNVTGVRGDLDRLFDRIQRDEGRLDIVFANAGVAKYAALGKITEDCYDSIFNINVK